jgi:hypothetical protein
MRNCLMCSHSFSPNLPQQKYCGPRCYVAANNARTRQDPAVKRCRTCTQSKTVDQFVVGHHNCNDCEALYADGLKRCSECRLVKPFADLFRRPRRSIPYGSKCKECVGRKAKTKNADPEQRARNQELKWRQRFGITRDEYSAMLQRQGGKWGSAPKYQARPFMWITTMGRVAFANSSVVNAMLCSVTPRTTPRSCFGRLNT